MSVLLEALLHALLVLGLSWLPAGPGQPLGGGAVARPCALVVVPSVSIQDVSGFVDAAATAPSATATTVTCDVDLLAGSTVTCHLSYEAASPGPAVLLAAAIVIPPSCPRTSTHAVACTTVTWDDPASGTQVQPLGCRESVDAAGASAVEPQIQSVTQPMLGLVVISDDGTGVVPSLYAFVPGWSCGFKPDSTPDVSCTPQSGGWSCGSYAVSASVWEGGYARGSMQCFRAGHAPDGDVIRTQRVDSTLPSDVKAGSQSGNPGVLSFECSPSDKGSLLQHHASYTVECGVPVLPLARQSGNPGTVGSVHLPLPV